MKQFILPPLPYTLDALEPMLSKETLEYHYGKHHAAYITNLNGFIEGSDFVNMPIEDIVKRADGPVFNNAAQAYNHTFYWYGMKPPTPNETNMPLDHIGEAIRDVTKLRGTVEMIAPGSLPNDGKVIEDARSYK